MSFGYLCRIFDIVIGVERGSIVYIGVVGKDTGVMVFWMRGCVWCCMCRQV